MKENFIKCGLIGLCIEIIFTGCGSAMQHDYRLTGHSSILMFPIYGAAALIRPVFHILKKYNMLVRGLIYMICIFITEFASGKLLKRRGICPWDYSKAPSNIQGLIRLDFAPLWFFVGLLFEKVVTRETDGIEKRSAAVLRQT